MDQNEQIIQIIRKLEKSSHAIERKIPKPRLILQGIARVDPDFSRYISIERADDFLEDHPWARDCLQEAFEGKNFDDIRKTLRDHIELPDPTPDHTHSEKEAFITPAQALQHAFINSAYRGKADVALFQWLTENEKLSRQATPETPALYGKFASGAQATGCGKSRTMLRLGLLGVFVIYMNLKSNDNVPSYPPRDDVPAKILRFKELQEFEYGRNCCAFFAALFRVFREYLEEIMRQTDGDKDLAANEWHLRMCLEARDDKEAFFQRVDEEYERIKRDIKASSPQAHSISLNTVSTKSGDPKTSSSGSSKLSVKEYDGELLMEQAYSNLIRSFPAIFNESSEPKLVIVIDEADSMRNPREEYSQADVICRAISKFSRSMINVAIWTLFASTESKMADFAAPSHLFKSARVAVAGERIVVPFTTFGWDQMAPKLGSFQALEVAKAKHMILYGRPLWVAVQKMHQSLSGLEEYALQKLLNSDQVDLDNTESALALLAQRFCLHVAFGHPKAIDFLDSQVSTNMRICIATTEDRTWRYTSYPSEPFLSHVAAKALHQDGPHGLASALRQLRRKLTSGLISIGSNGELVSRILWLLGKDLAVHDLDRPAAPAVDDPLDVELQYCRMVPVTSLIAKMFNNMTWSKLEVMDMAMNAFEGAYVNISHWIAMEEEIEKSKKKVEQTSNEPWNAGKWLLRMWTRSAAVQCSHQQPNIDKVIPIYFNRPDLEEDNRMSYMLISDKFGQNVTNSDLNVISRARHVIDSNQQLPYIAVLMDLGNRKESGVSASYPVRDGSGRGNQDRCLRLHAKNIGPQTYKFLTEDPDFASAMTELTLSGKVRPHELLALEDLQARICFGSTLEEKHMVWEREANVDVL